MKIHGLLFYCFLILNSISGSAQNAPVTTAAAVTAGAPGQISVPVTVTDFNGIGAISLTLDYDYSVLQFLNGIPNTELSTFIFSDNAIAGGKHRIIMSWFGTGISLPPGSILITLQFNYISGGSSLVWYDNGLSCEYADGNGDALNDSPKSYYYRNGSVSQVYGLSGTVSYYKPGGANLPLNNIELWLMNGSDHIASSVTSGTGSFEFTSLDNGTYTIIVHENDKPVGGINATDAGLLNWWSSHPSDIEQVKYLAGDVQNDYWIQSTDAYKVQQYFVYGVPFVRTTETGTPWTYWPAGGQLIHDNMSPYNGYSEWPVTMDVTINGANVIVNILGLCIGDYNSSFIPGSTKNDIASVNLSGTGIVLAQAGQEVIIPLRVNDPCEVSAVSLVLNYPGQLASVTGITNPSSSKPVDWRADGHSVTIGWYSPDPVNLGTGATLLLIALKTKPEFTQGNIIYFSLADDPLNEIADAKYEPIQNASLGTPAVEAFPGMGMDPAADRVLKPEAFPNPFLDFTSITYSIPCDGFVSIVLSDAAGKPVMMAAKGAETAGFHNQKLETGNLKPGFYLATLTFESGNTGFSRTIRLVKAK